MATEFEQLKVSMDAQFAAFNKAIDNTAAGVDRAMRQVETRTQTATTTVERNVNALASRLVGFRGALGPLTAAAAAFGAIRFGENIATNIDDITKKAHQMGIAIDQDSVNAIRHSQIEWGKSLVGMQAGLTPLVATWARIVDLVLQYTNKAPRRTGSYLGFGGTEMPPQTTREAATSAGIPFGTPEQQLALRQKLASQVGQEPTAFRDLVAQMKIAADLAKETADQHEIDLKLIEAATAALADQRQAASLKGQNTPKVTISSVDQARSILGQGGVAEVESQIRAQRANEIAQDRKLRLEEARASAANPQPIPVKGLITPDQAGADAARIIEKEQAMLKVNAAESQYLGDLKEESRIAGLLPQQREQEIELLRVKDRFGKDFADQHEEEIRQLVREKQAAEDLAQIQQAAISQIANFGDLMEQSGGKFGKAVELMILDLAKLALRLVATRELEATLGSLGSGGGSGGLFSSLLSAGASLFGGGGAAAGAVVSDLAFAAADGANVSAGQMGIVGEKGPELFVPRVPGTIIPNNKLGGGPVNFTINQTITGNGDAALAAAMKASAQATYAQITAELPTRVNRIMSDPWKR